MRLVDESAEELSTDEVAIIFSFLPPEDIIRARVCTTWRDAAKKTLVPLTEFEVNSVRKYNAMRVMSSALPNLQQLSIRNLVPGHKYGDGEDAVERWARHTADWATLDIELLSNFSKLRSLEICDAPLNGRYPALFNFPLLQKLTITYCFNLKWDLEMLSGLPLLEELKCGKTPHLTGNLNSLRVLKDTLEKVKINCRHVEGKFMELADFTRLKSLDLRGTVVRGDIRDIRRHNFPVLENLFLPNSVIGGIGYKFQNVADVPIFMQAIRLLLQRSPTIFGESENPRTLYWSLSRRSPHWYDWDDEYESGSPPPPFDLQFIQGGSCLGWSWYRSCPWSFQRHSCEVNWLDPEPDSESSDYEAYIEELQRIERYIDKDLYRGYYQPPTQEEYRRLCVDWLRDSS